MNRVLLFCCKLIFPALWSLPAVAEPAHVPVINVVQEDSTVRAEASVALPMRPCAAYAMLTDYENLPDFIPGLLQSRAERMADNRVKVRQVGEVPVLFFHVRMESLLEMQEIPYRRIDFRQIEGDLVSYAGEWNFTEVPEGTRIYYRSEMKFKPYVPLFVARSALKRDVRSKFAGIVREAEARAEKGQKRCGEASG